MRTLIALLTLATATLAAAAEYERRLIPVTVLAPGGYGTFWWTRATAVQELGEGVEIIGDLTMDLPPGIGGSQPYNIFPPLSQDEPPGAILHVPKQFADAILAFMRETIPQEWTKFRDKVSDNFRVITHENFRVLQ